MTTEAKSKSRIKVLAALVTFMFAALTTRLWFLQVLATEQYREAARSNRVRLVPVPAPRGRILDRNGELLVSNRASIVITLDRNKVRNEEALLLDLAEVLDVPARVLKQRVNDPRYLPFQPIPIAQDVSEDVVFFLAEHADEFPGVGYQEVGVREYPYGSLAAHVLGYLGEISEDELGDPAFAGYRPSEETGRGGVEQHYEQYLHGREGRLKVEVDALGRQGEELGRQEPVEGYDLVLSVDRRIQQLAETSLQEGIEAARRIVDRESGIYLRAPAGAVVVMDPSNARVLALASFPSYDPRIFLGRLTEREFDRLRDPAGNFPLNNRAIQGQYPPGSAFKPFVAADAIKAGYASPAGFYNCPAEYQVPGDTSGTVFRNWKTTDSGVISLPQSLIESCDTVFYQFGYLFYRDRKIRGELFQRLSRRWGFGHDEGTGVDIPSEQPGRVPDAGWKEQVHDRFPNLFPFGQWLPGDDVNMSVGQGDLLVTPLQMAVAYSALANGGTLYRPRVGLRVQTPEGDLIEQVRPAVTGRVPFSKDTLTAVRDALRHVPVSGTAGSAFAGFPLSRIPVAGKTGTAEFGDKQPHSWFAAMAPAGDPEYVVVALVEEGGHGSQVAAPLVRRVLEGLFGLGPDELVIGEAVD